MKVSRVDASGRADPAVEVRAARRNENQLGVGADQRSDDRRVRPALLRVGRAERLDVGAGRAELQRLGSDPGGGRRRGVVPQQECLHLRALQGGHDGLEPLGSRTVAPPFLGEGVHRLHGVSGRGAHHQLIDLVEHELVRRAGRAAAVLQLDQKLARAAADVLEHGRGRPQVTGDHDQPGAVAPDGLVQFAGHLGPVLLPRVLRPALVAGAGPAAGCTLRITSSVLSTSCDAISSPRGPTTVKSAPSRSTTRST